MYGFTLEKKTTKIVSPKQPSVIINHRSRTSKSYIFNKCTETEKVNISTLEAAIRDFSFTLLLFKDFNERMNYTNRHM